MSPTRSASLMLDLRNATGGLSQRKSHRDPPTTPAAGATASPPVPLPRHEGLAAPTGLKVAVPPQAADRSARATENASTSRVLSIGCWAWTYRNVQDATARDLCTALSFQGSACPAAGPDHQTNLAQRPQVLERIAAQRHQVARLAWC